jgi:hypothetical protein
MPVGFDAFVKVDQIMKELHKSYLKDRTDCESNVLYV